MARQGGAKQIAPRSIGGAQHLHVRIEAAQLHERRHHMRRKMTGPAAAVEQAAVGAPAHDRRRREQPADAQAGREQLAERAEPDDVVGREIGKRRRWRRVEPQMAIDVVFQDRQAGLLGQGGDRLPAVERQRRAGRIAEVRHEVEEARLPMLAVQARQRVRQGIGAQPVRVAGDRDQLQPMIAEDAQRQVVRRRIDQDRVARSRVERAQQIEPLREAAGDEDPLLWNRPTLSAAPAMRRAAGSGCPAPAPRRSTARRGHREIGQGSQRAPTLPSGTAPDRGVPT